MNVTVRPARLDDQAFLMTLVSRFTASGLPAWRDEDAVRASVEQSLAGAVTPPAGGACLIAEDDGGVQLGFVRLTTEPELFTGEPEAYIADLAVAPGVEGQGVAGVLLGAAEAWARAQGLPRLTLNVFATNLRARAVYARHGFDEDHLKLVKLLGADL